MAQHKRRGRKEVARRQNEAELRRQDRANRTDLEQAELLVSHHRPGHSFREVARLAETV